MAGKRERIRAVQPGRSDVSPRVKPVFPPPWQRPRNEFSVLDEREWSFSPLLWQRARDVRLWAITPSELRSGLFTRFVPQWQAAAEAAALEIEALSSSIRVVGALVRYPELVYESSVSDACISVSLWADANHLVETALEYAEAAAVADQTSAYAAAHAGQLCARRALDDRAEVWYERGIKLGRRTESWEWYIRSNLRMGILRYEQGNFRAAKRCYSRAHSKAVWAGLPAFAGKAHHDMLLIAIALGSFRSGDLHAGRALEYYPVRYERLPQLAHDYAVLLTTVGRDADALTLLDVALPLITLPSERIAVIGTIAKAAAGVGDTTRYHSAVNDIRLLASMSHLNAAGALALASEGAVVLETWEVAEQLARMAAQIGAQRKEREPKRRAEVVLEAVAARTSPPLPRRPAGRLVEETLQLFLARLNDLGAQTTDAGAHSRGRAELTKFTIAGR